MGFSTLLSSSRRSVASSRKLPGPTPSPTGGTPLAQLVQVQAPFYVLPLCPHTPVQDAQQYWLYPANPYPAHLLDQQYASSQSVLALTTPSNACPQCRERPKHPNYRFCSVACSQSAAWSAPELKYLDLHHVMSINVATQFVQRWGSGTPPRVLAIYMITWSELSQTRFGEYRATVEARGQFKRRGYFPGNEQKRFRSTARACTLGEGGNVSPCYNEACWMCETIRCGFQPHLDRKRTLPWNGNGIRLGAGIYTSNSSSKAGRYARNIHDPNSRVKAMLVCRVIIGRPYVMYREDRTITSPPEGYDCVFAEPGDHTDFDDDEYVVYDADAIRAAYLILYDMAPGA